MIRFRLGGALLATALVSTALSAQTADTGQSGRASVSAGFDYSSGTYGSDVRTRIWDVPFTVGYDTDKWSLKLTVPYVNISGSGNVIPGVGKVDNGNPIGRGLGNLLGGGQAQSAPAETKTSGSASGLGDIVARATYHLFTNADSRFGIDVGGHVKFGTADENKGLGTGKNDYGVNVDLFKGVGAWTLFGGVGYTDYGSSQYIRLDSGANANVGANYKASDSNSVGAYYYYRERVSDSGYPQREATLYWNHSYNANWRLQAYTLAGLSDGSPDWGGGLSLKYSF
jgi:hypothetical protein